MDKVDEGIVGIITNHSFLDNPTFRGMRQSLLKTFDQLYFIDLHGNVKKKEVTPEGRKDENIFDIEQGVVISIMVKKRGLPKKVFHSDFWGLRKEKYKQCYEKDLKTLSKNELKPKSPYYLLNYHSLENQEKYQSYFFLPEIFKISTSGVKTHNDKTLVGFSDEDLIERLKEKYKIEIDKSKIKTYKYRPFDDRKIYYDTNLIGRAREKYMFNLSLPNISIACVRQAAAIGSETFDAVFVTDKIVDTNLFRRGGPLAFPLYIYSKETTFFQQIKSPDKELEELEKEFKRHEKAYNKAVEELIRHENEFNKSRNPAQTEIDRLEEHRMSIEEYKTSFETINLNHQKNKKRIKGKEQLFEEQNIEILENGITKQVNFTEKFRNYLKGRYKTNINENDIIGYIYSILNCPTYQKKYIEFLNIDYPRIPFIEDLECFTKLAALGNKLIQAHLATEKIINDFKLNKNYKSIGIYTGKGTNTIGKVLFSKLKIFINKDQYFDNVSDVIFNYSVGGYPVLDKYLKERKEKTLTLSEINNIENTIRVIKYTISTKKSIDKIAKKLI